MGKIFGPRAIYVHAEHGPYEESDGDPAAGVSGNDFWTFGNGNGNGSAHSQTLGTGTGMINCIPNFWEREWE